MLRMICSECKKNIKSKQFIILIIAFLCVLGVVYNSGAHQREIERKEMLMNQSAVYSVVSTRYGELNYQIQFIPRAEWEENLEETYQAWKAINDSLYKWISERFNYSVFDASEVLEAARNYHLLVKDMMHSNMYEQEFEILNYDDAYLDLMANYYDTFITNKIKPTTYVADPSLSNFTRNLISRDSVVMLLVIIVAFVVQQLTHDFESGTYKQIYSNPLSREKILASKLISSLLLITASFLIAYVLFMIFLILNYGIGSLHQPYIINKTYLITLLPLISKAMLIIFLLMILYINLAFLSSLIFKSLSNSLIVVSSILVSVYFLYRIFGNQLLFALLPIFYIDPETIISGTFPYPFFICIITLIIWNIIFSLMNARYIKHLDMKGSDAS